MWKTTFLPGRRFATVMAAQRAVQKLFSRPLIWDAPHHGYDGKSETHGSTGVETDDRVTIRSER
jgi:hypothetical protein